MAKVAPSKTAEEALAEHQAAAERRAAEAEAPTVDPRIRSLLDALAAERRGYVVRGRADRVEQVDEQIKRLGG